MNINWNELFALSVPPLELVIRGSLIYWFLFVMFRAVLRRDVGAVAISDVLVLVLIADAAQNAMAGEYRSISDGLILISTIIGWTITLDWLAYAVPPLRRFFETRELCLVRDGRIIHRNLRRELISEEELHAKLRESGVSDVGEVRAAYMERDGAVSVIKRRGSDRSTPNVRDITRAGD